MIFERKINYHETDKMGITHHSNYVKFMEEARIAILESAGLYYDKFEADGLASPVVKIEVDYKHPSTYGDTLYIDINVCEYTSVRIGFEYKMKNQDGALVCCAKSLHCFSHENKICSLEKGFTTYHEMLLSLLK